MIIDRRSFLGRSAVLGAAAALTGCDTGVSPDAGAGGQKITWWDHNVNLQVANQAAYDAFTAETGWQVEYSYIQTAKLGQSLQLAKQSEQLPDIHTTAGLELSIPALIAAGWFQPIQWDDEVKAKFGDDGLVEGLHVFDGEVYSFPFAADKHYVAAQWFNKDFVAAAGIDTPPRTYDEFRASCRAVQQANDGAAGFIFALGHTGRLNEQVNQMAQAAGFPGIDGQLFETGEYAYHHDAYLTVIEFLLSLQRDKLIFPGVASLDDQTARVRWAAGGAGYYMDGPWCPGSVKSDAETFLDKVDGGPMLVPDTSAELAVYKPRQGGNYYISAGARDGEKCSQLLSHLVTEQWYTAEADAMAPPPFDLSVIDGSAAVEPWKRMVDHYQQVVFIAPQATLANPDVQKVQAIAKPVEPGLPEIVQGAFSGDVTDVRAALKKLSDASSASREQAITKATADGAEVSLDDYAFPNWKPAADFTQDMYRS